MTPMVFAKGLADSGCWGDKLFGRLVSEELRGGGHGLQKASRAKVIYGLEPIFESGRTCIIKVSSLLVFGPSSETSLLGRNYDVTIQVLSRPFSVLYSIFPFPIWLLLEAPCGDKPPPFQACEVSRLGFKDWLRYSCESSSLASENSIESRAIWS